jgi:multiple sugar transport system permease protein
MAKSESLIDPPSNASTGEVIVSDGNRDTDRARKGNRNSRAKSRGPNSLGRAGYGFVSGYFILLILFGVVPSVYAGYLALTSAGGHFTWFSNFIASGEDFRFLGAFKDVGIYVVIWLVLLVVLVLGVTLMLHARAGKVSSTFRFLFYLPGAFAGVASVLVWLFMLNPTVSPWKFALSADGLTNFAQTIAPGHLPFIFAIIAFWTGAGGWIVVMYGALNNIPEELMDASSMDGANAFQVAWYVKLPLIRKWVFYMIILAFATGTQLFVEPQLVNEASLGLVNPAWSPNQLAYIFAFQNNNFNYAAAVSLDLLVVGLVCAAIIVARTGLFEIE